MLGTRVSNYPYITHGTTKIPGVNDREEFFVTDVSPVSTTGSFVTRERPGSKQPNFVLFHWEHHPFRHSSFFCGNWVRWNSDEIEEIGEFMGSLAPCMLLHGIHFHNSLTMTWHEILFLSNALYHLNIQVSGPFLIYAGFLHNEAIFVISTRSKTKHWLVLFVKILYLKKCK